MYSTFFGGSLKIESSLWNLGRKFIAIYSNFQNTFLLFKNARVIFFLLIYFAPLKLPELFISTYVDMEVATFGHVNT